MTHEALPEERPRRSRRAVVIVAIAVVVVAAVVAAFFVVRSLATPAPAEAVPATVPVAISGAKVPKSTKIGVVITLGTGEGSEWNEAAQGALVAQKRLAMGGTDVELVTRNDSGTADGAEAAVQQLVDQGVAGIVVASSGSHVSGALSAAAAAKVPVVLPYAAAGDGDSWSTAPTSASTGAAIEQALGDAKAPLLVDLGGGSPRGVQVSHVVNAGDAADDTSLATTVAQRTGAQTADAGQTDGDQAGTDQTGTADGADGGAAPVAVDSDAVVVSGPADRQAAFLAALQAADVSVPVVLTADATSPAFGPALLAADGSLSGTFTTVGVETDDALALSSDASGRAMSAYLAAVRVLADDDDAENLTGDQAFSAVAWAADARSHDAVVALVRAVAAAKSTEPAQVTDALADLRLGVDDGVAGPSLDFTRSQAMRSSATVLSASSQSLGLRPTTTDSAPQLVWFAENAKN